MTPSSPGSPEHPGRSEHKAFPPQALRDYAFLADGERGALIGPRGEICWLCAPQWHDDAVFSTLIGGAGLYAVTPRGRFVPGGYYEEGSMIWRSRWITEDGIVECREALVFPGEQDRLVLLRRVVACRGPAHLDVVLHPVAAYGTRPLRDVSRGDDGVWTGSVGDLHMRWSGGTDARLSEACGTDGGTNGSGGAGAQFTLELALAAGQSHDLVLELGRTPPQGPPVDADRAWSSTEHAWEKEVPPLTHTMATRDARRSYAVLRGMTSAGGGMVAAATTSLPERAEEGRNYDYRYVWIRDQCITGQSIASAGPYPLLDDAVGFVSARLLADGSALAPAYTVLGGPVPGERELPLAGYPGGYDRVGNDVGGQFQLDVFGEALLLFAAAEQHGRLGREGWQAAVIAADAIARRWQEQDGGVWELNERNWTHSRLICVAGLRRMAALAPPGPRAREWSALAETIAEATAAAALHPAGRWQRAPDDPRLDAALLLPPLRGALPAEDRRTRLTLRAYIEELTSDHYAYRFRHDERPLAEAEGAFLLCGFVMALAEHQQGRNVEAHRWFERTRAACGPAGLYSEEFDVVQHQLRGNLPQAFVHAMLLETASRLATGTRGAG